MSVSIYQRCVGAIVGSLVGDAAAAPLHWIYDKEKMKVIRDENKEPEFMSESQCPFYHQPNGDNSCYGDQAAVLLKSLAENKETNVTSYKKNLYEKFGHKTEYDVDLGHPITREDYPISGHWRNKSIKDFIQNFEAGQEKTGATQDAQSDGFCKVAPLVALFAGDTDKLLQETERVVRVTQEDDEAVKCALAGAQLLEKIVLGNTFDNAIHTVMGSIADVTVKGYFQRAIDHKDKTHVDFVNEVGSSCSVPGNFINSIHCLSRSTGTFKDTLRLTLTAGGCNCSRTCFVGACLGALYGIDGVPQDWIDKTTGAKDVVTNAMELCKRHK